MVYLRILCPSNLETANDGQIVRMLSDLFVMRNS